MTARRLAPILLGINLVGLLGLATWLRVVDLGHLPGVNGDEAWYGVQAAHCLAGEPFATRTPTGLPLNPFLVGLEMPLLLAFEPAFWVLRAPAVLSGIAAIVLSFVLFAPTLGRPTAGMAAVLLATLPVTIGYSRFGWDASQAPLFGLIALDRALRGKPIGLVLAIGACLLIHPTQVLLLPTLLAVFLTVALRDRAGDRTRQVRLVVATLTVAVAIVGLVARLRPPSGEPAGSRLDFEGALRTLTHVGRLLSGISLDEFVVGGVPERSVRLHDAIFWGLALPTLLIGMTRLIRVRRWERVALTAGLVGSVGALHLAAGPEAIRPHYERYGMFLVAPAVLAFACQVRAIATIGGRDRSMVALWAISIVGWALLADVQKRYFGPLRAGGGESHRAFRTAEVEPKLQAYRAIIRDLGTPGRSGPRRIVIAEDWWVEWPLRFLATGRPGLEVIGFDRVAARPEDRPSRFLDLARSGAHAVGFAGGPIDRLLAPSPPGLAVDHRTIRDAGGRPLLSVWRLEPAEDALPPDSVAR